MPSGQNSAVHSRQGSAQPESISTENSLQQSRAEGEEVPGSDNIQNNIQNDVEDVDLDIDHKKDDEIKSVAPESGEKDDDEVPVDHEMDPELNALLEGDLPADLDILVSGGSGEPDLDFFLGTVEPLPSLNGSSGFEGLPEFPNGEEFGGFEIAPDAPMPSKEDIERERMQLLVSHFDEQQMSRYAAFRRANIRRASVKKFASHLLNQSITTTVALVLAGMSKVLIGDVIELARDLQEKEELTERQRRGLPNPSPGSEPQPLLPGHVREAWRIYKRETRTVPGSKTRLGSMNRMFK